MLEQFRSLTLEATVLESNNHSLESEAKSTKSCLRETQEKVQILEGKLLEKDSLIHGYETQVYSYIYIFAILHISLHI